MRENRPVIDLARGVLMASFGCATENAWHVLVTVSQNSNVKLQAVADAVVASAGGTQPMPADLQSRLQGPLRRGGQAGMSRG